MKLFVKYGSKFRPFILDVRVDWCALQRRSVRYEFLPVIELDAEAENVTAGCPVSGTRFVRNLRLRKQLYPNVLPEGVFRLENLIYTTGANGADVKLLNSIMWFALRHNDTRRF